MLDMTAFCEAADRIVEAHRLAEPGAYARWLWQDDTAARDLGVNPYGCADAANIQYTIGTFPRDLAERADAVSALQALQDSASGLFHEVTHHPIHTTAHCTAALELFDAGPSHPLTELAPLRQVTAMQEFLAGLDWQGNPWRASHEGAGLLASLHLAGEVGADWTDAYAQWLNDTTDPATGFFTGGGPTNALEWTGFGQTATTTVPVMAGSFHYLFNLQWLRQPLAHPARMIDSCIDMWRDDPFPMCENVGFAEIDLIYCLNRARRQTSHRFEEVTITLTEMADKLCTYLRSLDPETDDGLNDLHMLFGTLCAVAELQLALPGYVKTAHPLRLVLDRRPFI